MSASDVAASFAMILVVLMAVVFVAVRGYEKEIRRLTDVLDDLATDLVNKGVENHNLKQGLVNLSRLSTSVGGPTTDVALMAELDLLPTSEETS